MHGHAARAPHRPWLFYPDGWDWRWLSWGDAARRLSALVRRLESIDAPAPRGCVAAFPYRPRPSALLLDLALREAGWLSLPVAAPAETSAAGLDDLRRRLERLREEAPPALRPVFWMEDPEHPLLGGAEGPAEMLPGLPSIQLPSPPSADPPSPDARGATPADQESSGSVLVRGEDGAPARLSSTDLAVTAGRLDGLLRREEGRRSREILVSDRCLDDLGERLLAAWAVAAGAALVLAPEPATGAGVAAWIRPTVFHGDTEELEALAAAAGRHRLPWLAEVWRRMRGQPSRLPFGRLHTVFCRTGTCPGSIAPWAARGVEIRGAVGEAAGVTYAAARHSFVVHCEQMK